MNNISHLTETETSQQSTWTRTRLRNKIEMVTSEKFTYSYTVRVENYRKRYLGWAAGYWVGENFKDMRNIKVSYCFKYLFSALMVFVLSMSMSSSEVVPLSTEMAACRLMRCVRRKVGVDVGLPSHHGKVEGSIPLDKTVLELRISSHACHA